MKKLTFSTMAAARLRANKRQYVSLVLGIFLSIFMISTLVFSVWGIYQAELQKRYDKVGYLDMVVLDNEIITDEDLAELGDFDRIGHAYISGVVTGKNIYLGYYDAVGGSLLRVSAAEGRLPENPGEIAMEKSAMDVLEVDWQIGEVVELDITPIDGEKEIRQFTLVGIIPERSVYLEKSDHNGVSQFPAIVTGSEDAPFETGRLAYHFMLGLKENHSLSSAMIKFWDHYLIPGVSSSMYGLSISAQQVQFYNPGEVFVVENEMFSLILMVCVLAGSLILSCGVGISGAMEGLISKRREEIGVLRALGATRRQIRRMFGRENLLLALIVSPLSVLISMGAVWVLSLLLPGNIKFAVNLWLMIPIALFSVIVILISGYLPLVRASKLMPMSVIRDTAMLRRGKGVKSKKEFSAPRLISARQVRFNPTRQIGAALLVGLMLLCSGLLGALAHGYRTYTSPDTPAFSIMGSYGFPGEYIQIYETESPNNQSIRQIKSLDHVNSVRINREMHVLVQLDHAPRYALLNGVFAQYGMLDDEQFEQAMLLGHSESFYRNSREIQRKEYLQLKQDYNFTDEVYVMSVMTVELNDKNIEILTDYLTDGTINADAINGGEQVLVFAPNIWSAKSEHGHMMWDSEESMKNDPHAEDAELVGWNDSFQAGQTLPLSHLYSLTDSGAVIREDASVQVCAVVDDIGSLPYNSWAFGGIITTEAGLENMGIRPEGLREVEIYLDGEITLEEEELLERQITAVARRSEGYSVQNYMEKLRIRQQAEHQELILFISVVTVFFAVAVGMIVSSVTRQLHSEGRTIGMLRAVGADEKAILGCYSGQLNAAVLGGLGITMLAVAIFLFMYWLDALTSGYRFWYSGLAVQMTIVVSTAIVMAAACWLLCRYILRFRIREIVNKSIIDNIREL